VKAFSGRTGKIGGNGLTCQSIRHRVSLRLSAKRGIVVWLKPPVWLAFEIDPEILP
jgi:hypothetical protein